MKRNFKLQGTNSLFEIEKEVDSSGKIIPDEDGDPKPKKIREAATYRCYFCRSADFPRRQFILKIAKSPDDNVLLEQEAFKLRLLREKSVVLDERLIDEGSGPMFYRYGFPEVIDEFEADGHGGRKVLILGFDIGRNFLHDDEDGNAVWEDDLGLLRPIAKIVSLKHAAERVDPKTSAWMIGKALKILVFIHECGISVGNLSAGNILTDEAVFKIKSSCVAFFDFSIATDYGDEVPEDVVRDEIQQIARAGIIALTGNGDAKELFPDEQLPDKSYEQILFSLAKGRISDARTAHRKFYDVVDSLWGRAFHPYTVYSLKEEK